MKKVKLSQQLTRVFTALCEDANTTLSLKALSLFREGRLVDLAQMQVRPGDYSDPASYARDNNVVEFLRKLDVDVGQGLEEKARSLFLEIERQNKVTNNRLSRYIHNGPFEDPSEMRISNFFENTRKIIAGWLGRVPKDLDLRHGPGSTFADRVPFNTVPDKMTSRPTLTADATWLLPLWERSAWARSRQSRRVPPPLVVLGNRFTTVSKDMLKRRGICVEPSINVAYQLSVGGELRRRLKRATSIDLNEGQDLHKSLAQRASLDGEYATIDLSNASDTVALNLVRLLLPTEWFDLLSMLRSPFTRVKGKWHRLEKFSSMGNGYTFELETIIFAALAQAVAAGNGSTAHTGRGIWVYGDDIIVESGLAQDLLSCLKFCGFTANERKTFTAGPFRESCGGDFFAGIPVRAHYVKEDPIGPSSWFSIANGIRRLQDGPFDRSDWSRLYGRAWRRAIDPIPNNLRHLRGPSSLGDIVIHDDAWSGRHPIINGEIDTNQYEVETYAPVSVHLDWRHWHDSVQLASALYGVSSDGPTPRCTDYQNFQKGWALVTERPNTMFQ